jgi:decaprenylphospho-beta-D-ribofuranose 2-oxidase
VSNPLKFSRLSSFDRTEHVETSVARPERYADLLEVLSGERPFIARGAGLSYGAASMGCDAVSIDMRYFNRILAFDEQSGNVLVEPGLSVGALIEFLASRGFALPVVPGYPAISIGGCVGFDVHGKSQFHSGNFGEWVKELSLFHPRHGTLLCSREQNSELFELTIGGFGLTGMITSVLLRTERLLGTAIELSTHGVSSLTHAAELMSQMADSVAALYSWHNLTRSGRRFGSGFVFVEHFVNAPAKHRPKHRALQVTRAFPAPLWNGLTSRIALGAYETIKRSQRPRLLALRPAFFPIEGLEGYYAAFGRRGFREYQLIVPTSRFAEFETDLARLLLHARLPVTLASLKLFRGSGTRLRFRGEGICLALDVPAVPEALMLFRGLDELCERYGACVNLSKDSRIDADACRRLFPEYESFRERLALHDPERRCRSKLRERIDV